MAKSSPHQWVGAATFEIPPNVVRQANGRGTMRLPAQQRVAISEVYCHRCRQGYSATTDTQPCPARGSKDAKAHLIGGPIDGRRKRDDTDTREAM